MSRPNFGSLWPGEWPHDRRNGVGIHLTGWPRDRAAFMAALIKFECPFDVAWRHSVTMHDHGELKTTVLPHLDFPALAAELAECGVTLAIIAPQGYRSPV